MLFNITHFVNSVKRLVFDLTKIPFLTHLIGISRLIVEVIKRSESFLQNRIWLIAWFSCYVQFCSGDHFSE